MTVRKKSKKKVSSKKSKKKAQIKSKKSTAKKSKKSAAVTKPTPVKVYKVKAAEIEVIYDQMILDGFYPAQKNIKYSPSFEPMIEAHFADGKSLNDFAKLIKVSSRQIDRWAGLHVSFFQAKRRGEAAFIMGLPDRLLKWMDSGKSFETFAKQCGKTSRWLYALVKIYSRFAEAKELGEDYSLARWEDLGMAQVSGTLQKIKSVEPMLDKNGNPIIDKATGEARQKITYTSAMGSDRTFKTMMSAKFKKYSDGHQGDQGEKDELAEALAILEAEERATQGKN